MSTHKITAGHGYTYLTRQTMAHDGAAVTSDGLGAYYSEHGEAPGRWLGSGLAGLGIEAGALVSEQQMIALFGEGRHPDAVEIAARLRAEGHGEEVAAAAAELGTPFVLNKEANEFRRQVAQLAGEWNLAQGRPACAPAPDWLMARIRTAVGSALFAREQGREPADARELADFIARASRLGSKAVAGFDLTFSPVKSVSALWALAPKPIATQIEAAHHAAVANTIGWLERTATFTRLGRNGVRQVDTRGLIAAAFVHRASRAGDPDLHTHVAVSNKVQTLDGRWRALDGRVLFKATVAASERYNTRLEAELRDRLGVRFVERGRAGKRPVREIAGVDERLLATWSRRRSAIDARRAELSAAFQNQHHRPPTPVEAIALAQQATLETRPDKHHPTSELQQRASWRAEAEQIIGRSAVTPMLDVALGRDLPPTRAVDSDQLREVAERVVDRVQSGRATWQRWHILAEAQRAARGLSLPADALDDAVDAIVSTALEDYSIALTQADRVLEPLALRRGDGTSVYTVAGSQLYTSRAVLNAERVVLDAAQQFDAARVHSSAIEIALLESAANGLTLNAGQVRFVRELASSGARCQLALAPAGTGKTTAVRVLARAWLEGGGTVVGLAPSAAAAHVLGESIAAPAETLAKALHDLDSGVLRLAKTTLIVVDEAGMASTPDLAMLIDHARRAGAAVRLIGDDRQLAAIGAGGLLRDLAETTGVVELDEAVRFTDPVEAGAAAGIRAGSPTALDFYIDDKRVHVGDEHTAAMSAYEAWAAERAAGRDTLLLAATRAQVTALNVRARADRLAASGAATPREVHLADGTAASAGDAIITRRNDRRLGITATDWVKNGDRWTVDTVHPSGDVTAIHRDTGRHVTLPAQYVAEHVALGYAVTIHAAQGSTVDACHTVITGAESRQQLYVALTRGRDANHVHVALPGGADEHAGIRPDTLRPPTAEDMLRRVLDRDEAARSATTERRGFVDPYRQLREAVARYIDGLETAPIVDAETPAGAAPLAWLPPVPHCNDEAWTNYLRVRGDQITELANAITRDVRATSSPSTVLNRSDPTLLSNLEIWSAVHGYATDAEHLSARERLYWQHLEQRRTLHPVADHQARWRTLVEAVAPTVLASPDYDAFAQRLTAAHTLRIDVDRWLPHALAERNLSKALERVCKLLEDRVRDELAARQPQPRTAQFGPSLASGLRMDSGISPPSMSPPSL